MYLPDFNTVGTPSIYTVGRVRRARQQQQEPELVRHFKIIGFYAVRNSLSDILDLIYEMSDTLNTFQQQEQFDVLLDIEDSLIDILESEGYQTRSAHSAEEAEKGLAEFEAEVALLDFRLGGTDGIQLMDKLRQDRPELICLMMTAYAEVESAIETYDKGVYAY